MKNNWFIYAKFPQLLAGMVTVVSMGFLAGCDPDDPEKEDTPEMITRVTLTFTPSAGGDLVVVTASDPDGEGIQDMTVDGPANLNANSTYTLTLALINELAEPADPGYNITAEVEEEGDEHMLFFAWTNQVFSDPAGDGNMDNRKDALNYGDEDENGLPVGLKTLWTTAGPSSGTLKILLKHQPGLKTETSTSSEGETDMDAEFTIQVQ